VSRVYRSRGQSRAIAAMVPIWLGFLTGILLSAPSDRRPLWVILLVAAIAVGGAAFMVRCARAGVHVAPDGIRVVNPTRSFQVPWSEIRGFSLGPWSLFPLIGLVELRDGRVEHLWGIQAPNPRTRPNNCSAQELIAELNGELGRRGGERAAPPSLQPAARS
jgi:Bacterial PH domain